LATGVGCAQIAVIPRRRGFSLVQHVRHSYQAYSMMLILDAFERDQGQTSGFCDHKFGRRFIFVGVDGVAFAEDAAREGGLFAWPPTGRGIRDAVGSAPRRSTYGS